MPPLMELQIRPWPPPIGSFTQTRFSGMIKMDVYDLLLAIPLLNFIQNEL
jgi:hypothetical protein